VNLGVIELTRVVVLPIMPRVVGSDLVLKSERWLANLALLTAVL
jgi:hypothetical protein